MGTSSPSARGRGRELALGVLCHLESYPDEERALAIHLVLESPPGGDGAEEDTFVELARDPEVTRLARRLVELVELHRARLDGVIAQASTKWRLERMDRVDRNVVRLAATELDASPDTPRGVVLAEAVRLASRYGNERSAPFVNGLVEALAGSLRDVPRQAAVGEPRRDDD